MNRPLPQSPIVVLAEYAQDGLTARYLIDETTQRVGLLLLPSARMTDVEHRRWVLPDVATLPAPWDVMSAWQIESLVELSVAGDERTAGYAQGRTMRGGVASANLRFVEQNHNDEEIITVLGDARGLTVTHRLHLSAGSARVRVRPDHRGSAPLTIELLSSIALMGITPFCTDEGAGRLHLHRIRSSWSAEGRAVSERFEDLHLERSWQGHSVTSERFGQLGSMPVRGFVPLAGIEDRVAGVTWAVRLHHSASWQIEAYRRGDCACLAAGLADREFGHWSKRLQPGEGFDAPEAWATAVNGGFDAACATLLCSQPLPSSAAARGEDALPIIANEFCTTWGNPTHDRLKTLAEALGGRGVRYLVIDAGWYCDTHHNWIHTHGDWQPAADRFPQGLAAAAAAVRACGLIPGIWFEIETVGRDSAAWHGPGLLQRDGVPLTVSNRRFHDLADPTVFARVYRQLADILHAGGFGYLKIDYNETTGIGLDGTESPGEELRLRADGFHRIVERLRADFPQLVIESCSSGGHRLEPSILGITDMSSFSDAHECVELPVIAANTLRWVPARQNQIWAVLRGDDSPQRTAWSLAATFLGRMCLSGDLAALPASQQAQLDDAIRLYQDSASCLRDGLMWRFGTLQACLRRPQGWQAVRFASSDTCLIVVHAFPDTPTQLAVALPPGSWQIDVCFGHGSAAIRDEVLCVDQVKAWQALVIRLTMQQRP